MWRFARVMELRWFVDRLIVAGLRFAVFMNLLVTGSPGWTPPQEAKFIFQEGRKTEL